MKNEGLLLFIVYCLKIYKTIYELTSTQNPNYTVFQQKTERIFLLERVETYWSLEACIDGCLERLDIVIY